MRNKFILASVFSITAISVMAAAYQHTSIASTTHMPVAPTYLPTAQPLVSPNVATSISAQPKVELVFVLDTTGSMGGLIQAAKEKIWSIASNMASAQPAPEISIGLVAYRDRGDAYVTKRIDLSQDLDAVYSQLLGLSAAGGGDGPESVNAALFDAVHSMSWSQDPNSYKVVFLVGDAPGHNDYQDDVPFATTIAQATKNGIIVNTIQAGQDMNMVNEWRKIAALGQGDTFQVGQQGSAIAIKTPFDEAIVAASKSFEDTRVYYGRAEEQQAQLKKIEVTGSRMKGAASISSMARRAKFNASEGGEKNFTAGKELLQAIESDQLELADIPESEMPTVMQSMDMDEKKNFVATKVKQRKESKAKLRALSEKRDAYIKQELGKNRTKESLDEKLYATIKRQATKKGLDYSDAEESY